jgi:hypothetical protein
MTREYCHGCFPDSSTDEPSPGWRPPGAPSPYDWEFYRDVPECLIRSDRGESRVASHLELAAVGEGGAPSALAEPLVFLGLGGFYFSGMDFLVEGLRGFSTFGDSPLARTFFACRGKGIS